MNIKSIKDLYNYLIENSGFSADTIRSVIYSLGYILSGTKKDFKELSGIFLDCYRLGADNGFSGFRYFDETLKFYLKNRQDIINHMEQTAQAFGEDIISMVQNFGIFRNSNKPKISDVGKALWDNRINKEYSNLYKVFAWYTIEEISRTWNDFLEDNPVLAEKLSA